MVGIGRTVGLLRSPVSYTLKKTPRNEDEFLDLHFCVAPRGLIDSASHSLTHTAYTHKEISGRLLPAAVLLYWPMLTFVLRPVGRICHPGSKTDSHVESRDDGSREHRAATS